MIYIDKIFFYGHLKSDGLIFPMFQRYVQKVEKGYTYGSLYQYKGRPVFINKGGNKVYGEIVTLFNTKKVLKMLDNIESYLTRVVTDVYYEKDNKKVKAFIYIIENVEDKLLIPIPSGVWVNNKKGVGLNEFRGSNWIRSTRPDFDRF
jgi:gamma-glutamylcyclotransferase (GGCT)/AIG2-like uncharacterized protein YtfP